MRKFNTTGRSKSQRFEKAAFRGQIWNVVSAVRKDEYGHMYYRLRSTKSDNSMTVRSDKIRKV